MRWLPPLPVPMQSVTLPLADRSAAVLFDLLLNGESPAGQQRLRQALQLDAPLALWTLFRCVAGHGRPLSGEELAVALQRELPACLEWPVQPRFDVSANAAEGFARLASDNVAVAQKSAELAAADGSQAVDQAYILGLLSAAPKWLARCGGANLEVSDVLPGWLHVTDSTSSSSARSCPEVGKYVLQAVGVARDRRLTDSKADSWWTETVPLVEFLPELSRRLRRLQQLEEQFAATLEDAKLKALYTLAAGAGHEINNPLGSIAGRAQLLLRDEQDAERRRTLAKINSQAFRAHEMISDMMLFAKPPQPVLEAVDLAPLAQEVLDSLRETAEQRNTALLWKGPPQAIIVNADRAQLSVALRAMCLNSIEALGGGGHLEIRLGLVGEGASRCVEITVQDDGPGISDTQREHIFDPFYSGREAGRGLGFGLSKTWRIVENHGGRIDVQSAAGQGSTFRICLPAA